MDILSAVFASSVLDAILVPAREVAMPNESDPEGKGFFILVRANPSEEEGQVGPDGSMRAPAKSQQAVRGAAAAGAAAAARAKTAATSAAIASGKGGRVCKGGAAADDEEDGEVEEEPGPPLEIGRRKVVADGPPVAPGNPSRSAVVLRQLAPRPTQRAKAAVRARAEPPAKTRRRTRSMRSR